MRYLVLVTLALLTGLGLGAASAVLKARGTAWDGNPAGLRSPESPFAPSDGVPKVVVQQTEYKFGSMEPGKEGSHDFTLSNQGTGRLMLVTGSTSCSCALSKLEKTELKPGESTKVTLTWRSKDYAGPYKQTATILTSDRGRPEVTFTVVGEVSQMVRADPPALVFTSLTDGQEANGQVRLLSAFASPPLEVLDHKLSDQATARCFTVRFEPAAPTEEEKKKGFRSACLLRVTAKPGLPQGPFEQTILLRLNQEAHPALAVTVKGVVGSDIAIAGRGWNPDRKILDIGPVGNREAIQRQLVLLVRGSHAREVRFKCLKCDPDFLQVSLGETKVADDGAVSRTSLVVEIPKGSPPVNRLGTDQRPAGEILLETTHPQVPRLRIMVGLAIEE